MKQHSLGIGIEDLIILEKAITDYLGDEERNSQFEGPNAHYQHKLESFIVYNVFMRINRKITNMKISFKAQSKFKLHQIEVDVLYRTVAEYLPQDQAIYSYLEIKAI